MRKNTNKFTILMLAGVVVTVVACLAFIGSSYFAIFQAWSQVNSVLFFVVLVAVKILGIVWPPIPGGLLTIGAIPFLGWFGAYTADLIGSAGGSIIAYLLGRKYGYPFLRKILDDSIVEKIKQVKIKKNREFEGIFFLRLAGGSVIEVIVYAAGLMKVNFKYFLTATVLSHLLVGIPTFYFANEILSGGSVAVTVVSLILLVMIFAKFRNRYFEW